MLLNCYLQLLVLDLIHSLSLGLDLRYVTHVQRVAVVYCQGSELQLMDLFFIQLLKEISGL